MRHLLLAGSAMVCAIAPLGAHAQETGSAQSVSLEEVVVTAQRREEICRKQPSP
jgi:outer membrane cobalamin receptor